MPVTNYAPELLEVFRRASREELEIPFPSPSDAARVRFRLHNLRKEMREEKHHLLAIAESVVFNIKGNVLIAKPADVQYLDALRNAGITIELDEDIDLSDSPSLNEAIANNNNDKEELDALSHFMGKGKEREEEEEK